VISNFGKKNFGECSIPVAIIVLAGENFGKSEGELSFAKQKPIY